LAGENIAVGMMPKDEPEMEAKLLYQRPWGPALEGKERGTR